MTVASNIPNQCMAMINLVCTKVITLGLDLELHYDKKNQNHTRQLKTRLINEESLYAYESDF